MSLVSRPDCSDLNNNQLTGDPSAVLRSFFASNTAGIATSNVHFWGNKFEVSMTANYTLPRSDFSFTSSSASPWVNLCVFDTNASNPAFAPGTVKYGFALDGCGCSPGTTRDDAATPYCSSCEAGKFKHVSSPATAVCTDCPGNSSSPVGSDAASDCVCVAGFVGEITGTDTVLGSCVTAATKASDIESLCTGWFAGTFDTGRKLATGGSDAWTCTSNTTSTTDPCDGGWKGTYCTGIAGDSDREVTQM